MGSGQTSRWKHSDTHADLRAFLGDAANLFTQKIPSAQRDQSYLELVHEYGLSSGLAVQAISALELARGDSHVAYELLAQWSIDDSPEARSKSAARIARRLARLDEQATHDEGLALEQAAWHEVVAAASDDDTELPGADETSVEQIIGKRFEEHLRSRLANHEPISLDQAQEFIAIGVREFGMRPDDALRIFDTIMHEVASRRAALAQDRARKINDAAASPDTLPDLDCIMEEEADLLDRIREPEAKRPAEPVNQTKRDAFRQYVDQRLENIRGKIVDARQWKKWSDHGTVHFGLTGNDAAHLIEERAHKRRIQVLTPQRAAEQLATLAAGLYHRHGGYTSKAKNRLMTAANQLGVDAAEVRRIIDGPPPPVIVQPEPSLPSYRVLIAASGLAASAMIAFFIWVAFSQGRPEEQIAGRTTTSEGHEVEQEHDQPFQAPVWWDRQTVVAAELVSGESHMALAGFAADSALERKQSALGLLDQIDFDGAPFLRHRDQFRQVFVGYLALEPEQQVALAAFREIADSVNEFTMEWPQRSDHNSIYWRLDVLLSAIESPLTTRARADAFAAALSETLQLGYEVSTDMMALRPAATFNVTKRCFDVLITHSGDKTPEAILAAHSTLSLACRPFVSPEHVDRFESSFLCSLLLDGRKWKDFRHLIRHQIGSPDMHNLRRFVTAYEGMANSETRDRLADTLISKFGLSRQPRTPEQTARVILAAIERGGHNDPYIERWESFTFGADQLLTEHEQIPSVTELPQAVLEMVHGNLLGAAVQRRDHLGNTAFDQYHTEGAPRLLLAPGHSAPIFPLAKARPAQPVMPVHVAKELHDRCLLLVNTLSNREQEDAWIIAVRIIDRWKEIPPPVATLLGRFILSPFDERLRPMVNADARRLLYSTDLQMGLAESVPASKLDDDALAATLTGLLGRRIAISESFDRADVRRTVLIGIKDDLTPKAIVDREGIDLNQLREHITRVYRAKARLLDVSPGAYLTASNPADILAAIVDQTIEKHAIDGDPLAADLRARLKASRFRAHSELEETVLLQRLWIDVLAWRVADERPSAESLVQSTVSELFEASDSNLLEQLFSGESAELQLWLLRNELD